MVSQDQAKSSQKMSDYRGGGHYCQLVSCSAGVTCNQNTMLKHRLSDLLKLNLKTVRVEVVEIHSIVHHINAYQNINS